MTRLGLVEQGARARLGLLGERAGAGRGLDQELHERLHLGRQTAQRLRAPVPEARRRRRLVHVRRLPELLLVGELRTQQQQL